MNEMLQAAFDSGFLQGFLWGAVTMLCVGFVGSVIGGLIRRRR